MFYMKLCKRFNMCDCLAKDRRIIRKIIREDKKLKNLQTLINNKQVHLDFILFYCNFCSSSYFEYPEARCCPCCNKDICWECDKDREAIKNYHGCDCDNDFDMFECSECNYNYCEDCMIDKSCPQCYRDRTCLLCGSNDFQKIMICSMCKFGFCPKCKSTDRCPIC